jgi:enoyl-[acyl-carrier protein] reductase I
MYEFADILSPLGNPTAADCGDYVVTLLSDMTKFITMQNLFHDGGFSNMGMTTELLHLIYHAAESDDAMRQAGFSEEMIQRVRNPRKL